MKLEAYEILVDAITPRSEATVAFLNVVLVIIVTFILVIAQRVLFIV